ncbi:MAG: hypothetical protein COB14_09380 [Alphaproteobacteria bacterium]|nr:MAG: hypothetical protein COB14_09380 [Alphaproteobacteria bacterium]
MVLGSNLGHAACSAGIPCTDYDIYTDTNAGTDDTLNGLKDGNNGACDGNFMNQIYSRAFMEASREVIMSEQLIHKPDSVLEYTCFDEIIDMTAHHGAFFSESQKWDNVTIEIWLGGEHGNDNNDRVDTSTCSGANCPDHTENTTINDGSGTGLLPNQDDYSVFETDRLDTVLSDLLMDTLQDYVDDNFDHTFMGEASAIDNTITTSSIGDTTYTCAHMSTIWAISKCSDFGEDDRFRSFTHLIGANVGEGDPRSIPEACSPSNISNDAIENGTNTTKLDNTTPGTSQGLMPSGGMVDRCPPAGGVTAGVNTGFSNDLIRLANNCDATSGSNINIYSSFDIMDTHTDLIRGPGTYIQGTGNAAGNIICSTPPLPTGIPIISYNISGSFSGSTGVEIVRTYQLHYDHICPNPGCYYIPVKVAYAPLGSPLPSVPSVGVCSPTP